MLTAWRADPIEPDVDLYDLFHAPYTPVPDPSPMMPPVGVQAFVLSYDTIKVTWADNSLPKNQKITDNRFYTVRWKTNIPANTKVKVGASCILFLKHNQGPLVFGAQSPRNIFITECNSPDSIPNPSYLIRLQPSSNTEWFLCIWVQRMSTPSPDMHIVIYIICVENKT